MTKPNFFFGPEQNARAQLIWLHQAFHDVAGSRRPNRRN
jgi:hypothetical protein